VATAVAGSPAKARPIESDINTATVISHPGTFITGKLPAFLGYRIPFEDCNGMKNRNSCGEVGLKFKTWVPRGDAAGIQTLPTSAPWGRSGRIKGIPCEGLIVMGAITKLSAGHESTWTFVVPNTEAIRGVPPESGLGNS
jgi:hypothetical protein